MDRRQFLIGTTSLVAGVAEGGLHSPAFAQAKPSQMVLMTWGGLFGDSMKESADVAFEKASGVKILQDRGSSPGERITKIKLSLNDQKFEFVQLHDDIVPFAVAQGALEPINRNSPRLSNLKNVPDRFIDPSQNSQSTPWPHGNHARSSGLPSCFSNSNSLSC